MFLAIYKLLHTGRRQTTSTQPENFHRSASNRKNTSLFDILTVTAFFNSVSSSPMPQRLLFHAEHLFLQLNFGCVLLVTFFSLCVCACIYTDRHTKICIKTCLDTRKQAPFYPCQFGKSDLWKLSEDQKTCHQNGCCLVSADFLNFRMINKITSALFRVSHILICCTVATVIIPLTAVIISLTGCL